MESSVNASVNDNSSCFERATEVAKTINLQITDYAYGLLDLQRKPTSSSKESVQSAYEVTEDSQTSFSSCTSTIEEAVSENFSLTGSLILPPIMFRSSNRYSLESTTESDEASEGTSTSGSCFVPTETESAENGLPVRIDMLSKSLENLQNKPKQTFLPIRAAKNTSIKKKSHICPKLLKNQETDFLALKKRTKGVPDLVYEDTYKNVMEKLRKLNLTTEEKTFLKVMAELKQKFKKDNKNRETIQSSTDSGLDMDSNKTSADREQDVYRKFITEVIPSKPVEESFIQVYPCNIQLQNKNLDCHSGQRTFPDNSTNIQGSYSRSSQSSEYVERIFVCTANGDEMLRLNSQDYLTFPTASINTGEILELLSSKYTLTDFRGKRKTRRSINSTMRQSYESSPILDNTTAIAASSQDINSSLELVNEPFRYSYASYEDITNLGLEIFTDEGKRQIKKHIYINEQIIEQTEKMLKYGVKTENFIGSIVHLEGERIRLLSKARRQVLISHLYRIPEPINEAVVRVTIENLKCMLNLPEEPRESKQQYFMCILQHKTTVYSTKIEATNKQGLVKLGGFFIFENVSNTFNIKIQLFKVSIPKSSKSCLQLPFLRNHMLPLMELVGEVAIGMLNIKNRKFTFKNHENIKSNEHKLLASIEASVVWPEPIRGFVTIGTGKIDQYPIWNRRWCVIEKAILKYYSYPSDEIYGTPLGAIDLKLCKSSDEGTVNYMGQKTLKLVIDKTINLKRLFLSPDNHDDYKLWSKHLDIILKLNNQWNNLKI